MEREQAIKYMRDLLKLMIDKKGSDLFITVEFPPAIKIDGKVTPVTVIEASPNRVTQVKSEESDGYRATTLAMAYHALGRSGESARERAQLHVGASYTQPLPARSTCST